MVVEGDLMSSGVRDFPQLDRHCGHSVSRYISTLYPDAAEMYICNLFVA